MADGDGYRSKLRTPKKDVKQDMGLLETSPIAFDSVALSNFAQFWNTPSPQKQRQNVHGNLAVTPSPHKSGYFLRTPSPPVKSHLMSPSKMSVNVKLEVPSTPSPHKAGSSTDLFGNKSLLSNLPDWDDNFFDNFQEDLLFGLGSEDLEGLIKSPMKSPRHGPFLSNSPFKSSPGFGTIKGPLLTSSPKITGTSPASMATTPGNVGGRPLTRQRKLFLQSPERQTPTSSSSMKSNWSTFVPLPSVDTSSSSMFSDGGPETTTSIQSISTYLRQIEEEDNEEELPVMPPVGWTGPKNAQSEATGLNLSGKVISSKSRNHKFPRDQMSYSQKRPHSTVVESSVPNVVSVSKRVKVEPQFTLLKPQTEILNNQICLRMTPRTPPNKVKISRDFSQIQTLPSKEQLRIVRNRFRETLNKAVEQEMEKSKVKNECANVHGPELRSAFQQPVMIQPTVVAPVGVPYNIYGAVTRKPQFKKKKR